MAHSTLCHPASPAPPRHPRDEAVQIRAAESAEVSVIGFPEECGFDVVAARTHGKSPIEREQTYEHLRRSYDFGGGVWRIFGRDCFRLAIARLLALCQIRDCREYGNSERIFVFESLLLGVAKIG